MSKQKIEAQKYIFQIRLYNPIYLDKTGAFIKATREVYENWEGGVNGFKFAHVNKRFFGGLSMYDFGLNTEFNTTHEEFKSLTIEGLKYISDIYEEPLVQRIGYRIIYLCELSAKKVTNIIEKFASPQSTTSHLLNNYFIDRNELFFRYKSNKDEKYVNFRLLYGEIEKRNIRNFSENNPKKGLIIDIDTYMLFKNEPPLSKKFLNNTIEDFFSDSIKNQKHIIDEIEKVVKKNAT